MAHPSNAKRQEVHRWSTRPWDVDGGEIFDLGLEKLAGMVDGLDPSGFSGFGSAVDILTGSPSGA